MPDQVRTVDTENWTEIHHTLSVNPAEEEEEEEEKRGGGFVHYSGRNRRSRISSIQFNNLPRNSVNKASSGFNHKNLDHLRSLHVFLGISYPKDQGAFAGPHATVSHTRAS